MKVVDKLFHLQPPTTRHFSFRKKKIQFNVKNQLCTFFNFMIFLEKKYIYKTLISIFFRFWYDIEKYKSRKTSSPQYINIKLYIILADDYDDRLLINQMDRIDVAYNFLIIYIYKLVKNVMIFLDSCHPLISFFNLLYYKTILKRRR